MKRPTDKELDAAKAWVDKALAFRGAVPEARAALETIAAVLAEHRPASEGLVVDRAGIEPAT